jgi:D-alanyl-lipoteichoic acid acyltransferase DltB (MBOAT superfamily)
LDERQYSSPDSDEIPGKSDETQWQNHVITTVKMMTVHDLIHGMTALFSRQPGDPLLFCSGTFWVLFVFFILIYAFVSQRKTQMMLYVAAFSLFFYFQNNGWIFLLMPLTAFYDFWIAKRIYDCREPRKRKAYLLLSIGLSISILAYFKYTNLFLQTWQNLFAGNFDPLDIFLPVGISFYTFQTISYVVDVYRGKIKPTDSFLQYLFYISFFPLILAGPIMRADKFFPQIQDNKKITQAMIYGGLWLIILGIVKKAIFADYIAQYNNWIFEDPLHYSGFEGLMGVIGYSAQIYCDFSGYSDISIGLASIMGFDLGKNFDFPYQSKNLTEFWRRWHISLSFWMRDYIYISLGGNRVGKFRMYLNNLITMLVAGLWHGASWMFVIWGGLHGVGLIIHKLNKPWLDKIPDSLPVRFVSCLFTFCSVAFLWIFFRGSSMSVCIDLITHIAGDFDWAYCLPFFQARKTWCIILILIFLLHFIRADDYEKVKAWFVRSPWIVKALIFLVVVQLVLQMGSGEVQPFIYFQF